MVASAATVSGVGGGGGGDLGSDKCLAVWTFTYCFRTQIAKNKMVARERHRTIVILALHTFGGRFQV